MEKRAMIEKMVRFYNNRAYTHNYMLAFNMGSSVMVVFANGDMLANVVTLDKASRGAGYSLRFKPTKAQKAYMMENCKFFELCTKADIENACATCKYNKGEIVEKFLTERYGQTWVKDNVAFTDDGDLTVDGIAYQIKYEKATFINEKQMERMA
jgi:hypothetical protein